MTCPEYGNCGGEYHWDWEEALDKFGVGDGDTRVATQTVTDSLEDLGYRADAKR